MANADKGAINQEKETFMGTLITETPYSEITATIELLDRWGVDRKDLTNFRKASSFVHQEVVNFIKFGDRTDETNTDVTIKKYLQNYFKEVFKLKFNLSKLKFPQKDGFNAYMVVSPQSQLNEDQIMNGFVKKWGIKVYKHLTPVAQKINRDAEQPRPEGLYIFAHRGGDEPDAQHLGKSYNVAKGENILFANAKEYLLITGFHKYLKGYFMDKEGWTRTSSLWSDVKSVHGYWGEGDGRLYLHCGRPDSSGSNNGPRELVLVS